MKTLVVLLLLTASLRADDFTTTARVSIMKSEFCCSYLMLIIVPEQRTVYISRDWCPEAGYVSGPWPAELNEHKHVIHLRARGKTCTYHYIDSRPLLTRRGTRQ